MSEMVWDILKFGFGKRTSESDSNGTWAGRGRLIGFRSPAPYGSLKSANLAKARAPRIFFLDVPAGNPDCFVERVWEGIWLWSTIVIVLGVVRDWSRMSNGISYICTAESAR